MKKEELRYDPVHDKIASIIDYINNNKKIAIQALTVIGLAVGFWSYYSQLQKDRVNISKSLVGVAQNAYNLGQVDISLPELKNIVKEYSGTDAGNQALFYLINDAYKLNNDENALSLAEEYGSNIPDRVLNAGVYEILGNAAMNKSDFDAAFNNFKKADKLSSVEYGDSRYKIDLAVVLILKEELMKASLLLNDILSDKNLNYSDKSTIEELLAWVNFTKDN